MSDGTSKPLAGKRILLTNDDGIEAPGLAVLEDIANALCDDVWVIAPTLEQSGASHSLTLHDPLRLRDIGERRFAVSGTPTDCVMMGVRHVLKDHSPDLVLSGVNRGQNMAEDVTYSGTIAGAMEGTVLGIPSIALSQSYAIRSGGELLWETARSHGVDLVAKLVAAGWPKHVLININFPDVPPDEVTGTRVTIQGQRDQQTVRLIERKDGRGIPYFWLGFQREAGTPADGTDLAAVFAGAISVTPLHLNLTAADTMIDLSRALKS